MRMSGLLIGIGIALIAMSGLVEGTALVRWVQDEPTLLLPMPCNQSLPVLIGSRLRLEALTDGVDHPMDVTVQWLARDGNGVVLQRGTMDVSPGRSSLLGMVPAGSRRELHLVAQVVKGSPRQAWLEVRPDAVSAASLALGGVALFVLGELALGLGTALSVWRLFWRFAKPIQQWWHRWIKGFGAKKKARRRAKAEIHPEDDLETKPDMASQTDTRVETAIPSEEEAETEVDATTPAERRPSPHSASTSISHDVVDPAQRPPSTTRRRRKPP